MAKKKTPVWDILLPAAAVLFFIVLYLLFAISLWLSIVLSAVFLAGLYFVSSPNRFRIGKITVEDASEYQSIESIVGDGYEKLAELKGYVKKLKSPVMAGYAQQICQTGDKIFEYIQKNPGKVRGARAFFSYYLGTSCTIFEKYCGIEAQGLDSPEIRDSMKKAEDVAKLLVGCYQKQLENLIQGDVFDLETEINVLRKTIQSGELS
ncbi:5-bromo-4-chloroindolyl phosphate hydrolysis family protein [Ethanoligenens harbinense]|uniref:5-bromo-4-chloroindolyl phosphate hydrolysis protein n=1 Tax=Ethanoligenens harbinense (strain DSM 18485 / JCM 12961 / CGMCC 1.5033 / YUAN-3) TaxID=663278 RepID=E6U4H4_ETHHY|nr:5-bromo-4-chloroindolyl phosphate hydrolysis family protein [Ethanoligenens harbinense]ADU27781.1 hypothetical protein Ethha_2267 [Ethanoligenens harbinense YUAN-3]